MQETQETRVQSLGQRIPGEGNGNPFQYSCLDNSMDGGVWRAKAHGVMKSRTRLSMLAVVIEQINHLSVKIISFIIGNRKILQGGYQMFKHL